MDADARTNERKEFDEQVAACMGGLHIFPSDLKIAIACAEKISRVVGGIKNLAEGAEITALVLKAIYESNSRLDSDQPTGAELTF